jgi:3-hydroxyisobutyrate dehydrogenase-like beta-hydroxyacid dehydrogenase
MTTIGFIGLGAMGSRIAGRLVASGHQVHGTNRTAAKAAELRSAGLVWRDTPREVAAAADVRAGLGQCAGRRRRDAGHHGRWQ